MTLGTRQLSLSSTYVRLLWEFHSSSFLLSQSCRFACVPLRFPHRRDYMFNKKSNHVSHLHILVYNQLPPVAAHSSSKRTRLICSLCFRCLASGGFRYASLLDLYVSPVIWWYLAFVFFVIWEKPYFLPLKLSHLFVFCLFIFANDWLTAESVFSLLIL